MGKAMNTLNTVTRETVKAGSVTALLRGVAVAVAAAIPAVVLFAAQPAAADHKHRHHDGDYGRHYGGDHHRGHGGWGGHAWGPPVVVVPPRPRVVYVPPPPPPPVYYAPPPVLYAPPPPPPGFGVYLNIR